MQRVQTYQSPALALDAADGLHATYTRSGAGGRYAYKQPGGGRTTDLVDGGDGVGTSSALDIDAAGVVHIAYR